MIRFNKSIYQIGILGLLLELIFGLSLNNPNLGYLGIVLLIMISLSLDANRLVFLFILLIPNQRFIVLSDSNISLLNILLVIILFKSLAVEKFRIKKTHYLTVLIFIIYSLLNIIYIGNMVNILSGLKFALLFLVLLEVFERNLNIEGWYSQIIVFFTLGCILSAGTGLLFGANIIVGSSVRLTTGGTSDANITALNYSLALSNLFVLMVIKRKYSFKLIAAISLILIFGLLTQSRSFVLTVLLCLLFFFIYSWKSRRIRKILRYVALLLIILVFAIIIFPEGLLGRIFYGVWVRIIQPRSGDISNSRFDLWRLYLDYLKANIKQLLFGMDVTTKQFADQFFSAAHNGLIEVIISWGVFGALLILSMFASAYRLLKRKLDIRWSKKISNFGYLPITVLIITNMVGHSFLSMIFVLNLFVSYLAIFETKKLLI